jgi:hypothetical protein
MNGPRATGQYSFDRPAVYQILLQGRLPRTGWNAMAGMAVEATGDVAGDVPVAAGEEPVTVLRGEVADQAALCGLLNQLYDLQLTILSVVRLQDAHGS